MEVRKIDKMIATVRKDHLSQKQARQRGLEDRRSKSLTRIGNAVVKHELPIEQSTELENNLQARLQQAQRARISESEAMADLAEFNGDLVSELYWWELSNQANIVLWKGYVINKRLARIKLTARFENAANAITRELDINVRRACRGEIVASLYLEGRGVRSVGVSSGENASESEAVINAYSSFVELDGEHLLDRYKNMPTELLDGIDSNNGCGITNLRSLEDATNSQRELEGEKNGNDV